MTTQVTLTLDRTAFTPGYRSVAVCLWPVGAYDQDWVRPDAYIGQERQVSWRFDKLPREGFRGGGFLLLVSGERLNNSGQLCQVFLGDGHLKYNDTACMIRDRAPQGQRHPQFSLRVTFRPSVLLPYITDQAAPRNQQDEIAEAKEIAQEQNDAAPDHADGLHLMEPERHDIFLRGFCAGVFGTTVRVSDWLYHVCQETPHAPTNPLYFLNLAAWYLRWRGVQPAGFVESPHRHADVLQFVVGHAAWSQPYCADECMNETTRAFRSCESFNSIRWLSSERLRAGDCEDLAACVLTAFYALRDLKVTPQMNSPILETLVKLAQQYTPFFVDTLYRGAHQKLILHAYVKLLPSAQVSLLARGRAADAHASPLPALFLDSTRRSWTPDQPLSRRMQRTLLLLVEDLRRHCTLDHQIAELFSWATPLGIWQKSTKNMYRLDIRYYEPRTRTVYAPQRECHLAKHLSGVDATYFDGHGWTEEGADRVVFTDVSRTFTGEGPFAKDAARLDPKAPTAWPPVPGLKANPERIPERWPVEEELSSCVPVFVRQVDIPAVVTAARKLEGAAQLTTDEHLVSLWLETACHGEVLVLFTEMLYSHGLPGDEVCHLVCYVRAAPATA